VPVLAVGYDVHVGHETVDGANNKSERTFKSVGRRKSRNHEVESQALRRKRYGEMKRKMFGKIDYHSCVMLQQSISVQAACVH